MENRTRYMYRKISGLSEAWPLDFHSPYGCSKGTADQYVKDYARIYGMPTIVFRQSCIYGCRQLGIEDQGWVAWFILAAICKEPIAVYGNGKQVRDVLFVDDLVKAYIGALENIETTSGKVYNIGGGPSQSISIWKEFQPLLSELVGYSVSADNKDGRAGDQPIFVADISQAKRDFDWSLCITQHFRLRIVVTEMKRLKKREAALADSPKGAAWKVRIAKRLRKETTANNPWIAERLQMGHPNYVSNLVNKGRF